MKWWLPLACLLASGSASATDYWQDGQNTNGYVSVVTPPAGACFLYQTAPFDVQCYTAIPSGFITVPNGVLEGVAVAITGYTATNHLVQYGAASGGGLAQSTGFQFDGTSTVGIAAPSSGVQESLQGSNSASFAQLTMFPSGGTAVTELLNLIPKGAGAGVITSGAVFYNTDGNADPVNTERLLVEGRGTGGYIILSTAAGTGTVRPIAIGTDASAPPKQLVLNTAGTTSFGTGDVLMTRLAAQDFTKTGGTMGIGTGDSNGVNVKTNGVTRLAVSSTGGITDPAFAGGGNQCVFVDNTGLFSVTGSACGTGSGAGGITQLTGDVLAGPGSGSQAATLVNLPNDVSQAGDLLVTPIVAPATPSASHARVYVDSTSKALAVKNDAGTVSHTAQTIASTTGVALTGLSDAGAWTTQNFQAPLVACTDYLSMTCVSGATDLGGTNTVPIVFGIENDAVMRGDLKATAIAAPATPSAGNARIYVDSTSKNLAVKNDAGTVSHAAQTTTATPHQWMTALSDAGVFTLAQPSIADISSCTTNDIAYGSSGALACTGTFTFDPSGFAETITNASTSGTATVDVEAGGSGGIVRAYGSLFPVASLASKMAFGPNSAAGATGTVLFSNSSTASGASGSISLRGGGYDTGAENLNLSSGASEFTNGTVAVDNVAINSIVKTNGSHVLTAAAHPADYLTPSDAIACSQTPAFTGDATKSSGSCATLVSAFEDGTTQKGVLNVSTVFAPSTPAVGTVSCWVDHFNGNYECKDSSASIYAIPKATTCSTGQAVSAITAGGTVTCTAPSLTCAALPSLTGDTTSSAGSCATQTKALTDGGGVQHATTGTWGGLSLIETDGSGHLTSNSTLSCLQAPTFSGGDVTSTGGTCSVNVVAMHDGGSVRHPTTGTWANGSLLDIDGSGNVAAEATATCAQLPAFSVGDVLKSAGSCTTKVISVTDLASVQWGVTALTNGQFLATSTIGSTIRSVPAPDLLSFFVSVPSLQAVNTANQQITTSSSTPVSSGVTTNPIEVPGDFVVKNVYLQLYLLASIGSASSVNVWATRNGTLISGTTLTFTPGTTTTGTILSVGPIATGSSSTSDTYGIQQVYNGNVTSGPFGAQMAYTLKYRLVGY